MKITDIEIFCADFDTKSPNQPIFIKINTDEGISGFGEAGVAYGNAKLGAIGQLQDFSKLILGENPFCIEKIWDRLYRDTFWGQGGGTVIFSAISAIDIALWDIKGKALNTPVYELLGGKTRDKVRAYASQIQFGWDAKETPLGGVDKIAEAAKKAVNEGYTAIKVDPLQRDENGDKNRRNDGLLTHKKLKLCRDRLFAIREAVGDDVDIILELHAKTDINSALQISKLVGDLNIYYMEEACGSLNPQLVKNLRDQVNIPLAAGERIFTRYGFKPFLETRALDIIQPDIATCGGISEGKKICDMARIYDVLVQPHVCGGPISAAAALQIEAVIPNFCIHEHHVGNLSHFTRNLGTYDIQPIDGYITVPDGPGIGMEITEETMDKCKIIKVQ
ncbi:mandelate racemase/muconate lactonizing enzyme family protein [Pectobacteriaceae bacterium CE90]|nr:mandelate racemase/muconate lactonizing enzyme family protein [Prodigiosinella sp. LS101]WJV53019.1 mandelate racemase/muconate lactonizing enzyme family protein [Prodigiosinella sp. LS101]WJV57374.1 mandelate racemase/muconate lactonizing enzyme family protein [Pectobacteriaceae bacterium C111]WJY15954.1 mandelate racemase/muconate lactonizing enzyme family protein [Pectobacteriaceae bacterium CE90]